MEIREAIFGDPSVLALIERHLAHCEFDSPPEKCHRLNIDALQTPDIRFFTLWDQGQAIACIALRDLGQKRGEIKSMHVLSERRGEGIADLLLDHLLTQARIMGINWLGLETGDTPAFKAARAFYEKRGFAPTGSFGKYDPENAGPLYARQL